ncbi:hypothetical protein E0Z10_g4202 [Xylaria hypoxylon]|uniref:FAD-binding domain-containing protein n=1 Tax=Xylaria hypoxylon TaxID=37992 RepID=A0A4Z0YYL9_9PEZI|nr:hypothetical protein E0Z10_g4202 [Xylaria hypoxylon]
MPGFRVVVLGAGPAGLFTAHALAAAGIDFIVLERQPEIVRYQGALLIIWAPFIRLMDQLGLYEQIKKVSTRITTKTGFTHNDEPLTSERLFIALEDELGYPTVGLSRGDLIRVFYENLPGKETKVRANAHAVNIETHKDGVHVHLADGSVVDGSIVIGADGVHSPARELIQRLESDSSATGDLKPTSPMVTTFMSLFGHTRGVREDVALGDFAESHGPGIASQSTRLDDTMYFTILKRLDKPTSEKRKFTEGDVNKFVHEMSDMAIFPGVKLKEIWPLREQANAVLLHQEEGLADKWYHGRVVIVGDAAHKMTSTNGQGALSAVLSATTLVNNLRATLRKNSRPSTEDLEAAFAKYQASRIDVARDVLGFGLMLTRFMTWTDEGNEALDRKLSRTVDMTQESLSRLLPLFSQSPILDFIPYKSKQGNTPWAVDGIPPIRAKL